MKVKVIPLHLLIHTAEYHEYEETARWGETYKAPVTLRNVRLFPGSYYKRGIYEAIQFNTFLLYDCTNSLPKDIQIKEKSKIVFGGKEMIVQQVNAQYAADDTPHHYEVLLQ